MKRERRGRRGRVEVAGRVARAHAERVLAGPCRSCRRGQAHRPSVQFVVRGRRRSALERRRPRSSATRKRAPVVERPVGPLGDRRVRRACGRSRTGAAAGLGLDVAGAVGRAHAHGVIALAEAGQRERRRARPRTSAPSTEHANVAPVSRAERDRRRERRSSGPPALRAERRVRRDRVDRERARDGGRRCRPDRSPRRAKSCAPSPSAVRVDRRAARRELRAVERALEGRRRVGARRTRTSRRAGW